MIDTDRHTQLAEELLTDARLVIGDERPATGSGGVFRHVNPTTGRGQAERASRRPVGDRRCRHRGPGRVRGVVEVAAGRAP